MLYLILATVTSMLVSVMMRQSERSRQNDLSMLAVNYLTCSTLAFLHGAQPFPTGDGVGLTLVLGAIGGVLYLGSFVLLQWNVSRCGVVLSSTFMKLGVIVPTVMAVTVFGETPRLAQAVGVVLAVAAIWLMQEGGSGEKRMLGGLVLLGLGGGAANAMSKVFEATCDAALEDTFLFYIFVTAFVLCVGVCLLKKQSLCKWDVLFGVLVGVPNYYCSRFLLLSLNDVPAMVAYPVYSVGGIVLAAVVGVLFYKERLSRRKLLALGIIIASLVLLNLK